MEIATAVRYSIPVIFLVSNNGSYYSVRKRVSTKADKEKFGQLPLIDWVGFAKSIGAEGYLVSDSSQMDHAIEKALASVKPFIIDLRTHPEEPFSDEITLPEGLWPNIHRND